jgi:hypothetical protein
VFDNCILNTVQLNIIQADSEAQIRLSIKQMDAIYTMASLEDSFLS